MLTREIALRRNVQGKCWCATFYNVSGIPNGTELPLPLTLDCSSVDADTFVRRLPIAAGASVYHSN